MGLLELSVADNRRVARMVVHCRLNAVDRDGKPVALLIVDLSERGLMARTSASLAEGATLKIPLPVVGSYLATVRWSLGGRIGCELDRPISLSDYRGLLAALAR